jgi:hypothetical protein
MMAELTSKERLLRVLQRQEPDRVPHFEWLIDRQVRAAILPGCTDPHEFAVRMGHDAVIVDPDFKKTPLAGSRYLSEWGYVSQKTQEEHGIEVESPIRTLTDLECYTPPNPHAPGRYDTIERTLATYGDRYAVIVHLNDVFSIPRAFLSLECSVLD